MSCDKAGMSCDWVGVAKSSAGLVREVSVSSGASEGGEGGREGVRE